MVDVSAGVQQQYAPCIIHALGVHNMAAGATLPILTLTRIGRYMTARLLSDKDLQLIRNFDKRPADTQDSLLKEVSLIPAFAMLINLRSSTGSPYKALLWCCLWQDGPAYVDTLLTVLRNVTKEETVQYVLALLDDIVTGGAADWCMHENHTICRRPRHVELYRGACAAYLLCAGKHHAQLRRRHSAVQSMAN